MSTTSSPSSAGTRSCVRRIVSAAENEHIPLSRTETLDDVFHRVANTLAESEDQAQRFHWAQRMGLCGGSRINAHAGIKSKASLVSGSTILVADRISGKTELEMPGIFRALEEAAETIRFGGNVTLDFSLVRPRTAQVGSTGHRAAGPVAFMRMFNAMSQVMDTEGGRQGSQTALLRVDHPDILEFIEENSQVMPNNLRRSVAVTDVFMSAVQKGAQIDLIHEQPQAGATSFSDEPGRQHIYRSIPARKVWDQILIERSRGLGIVFVDQGVSHNNLLALERYDLTPNFTEQDAAIVLPQLVRNADYDDVYFDWGTFQRLIHIGVEMLDRALDVSHWAYVRERVGAQSKRPIGLGMTGLDTALRMLGLAYDSEEGRSFASKLSVFIRDEAYKASVELAKTLGAFPLFSAQAFLADGTFASGLPLAIQESIREHGIRNSHLLNFTPAHTVTEAQNQTCSVGLGPLHADVDVRALLAMVLATAAYSDGATSRSINIPCSKPADEVGPVCVQAWQSGLRMVS